MNRTSLFLIGIIGFTSLQTFWDWWRFDRQYTCFILLLWSALVLVLMAYGGLLWLGRGSEKLMRLHHWAFERLSRTRLIWLGLLCLAILSLWYSLSVWGKPLAGFDYSTLLYRYEILDRIFPHMIAYNPKLNGGYETYELLSTGVFNLYLVTYPLTALFSIETIMKVQPLLLVLILPFLMYVSCRLIGYAVAEAFLPAMFALVITPIGYEGLMALLVSGLLPVALSCELAVLVFALGYRVFVLGRNAAWGIPLIILFGGLGSFHPLFALIIGPVFLAVVIAGTIPFRRTLGYCLLIALGILLINGVEIKEILAYQQGAYVRERFLLDPRPVWEWLTKLDQYFLGLRVALVAAAVLGLRQLSRTAQTLEQRRLRGLLLFNILYYVVLVAAGDATISRLQFFHFVTPLSLFLLLAAAPAWTPLRRLWKRMAVQRTAQAYSANAALAVLAVYLWSTAGFYFVGFPLLSEKTTQTVTWLTEHVATDGRILFERHDRRRDADVTFYQIKTGKPALGFSSGFGRLPGDAWWPRTVATCLTAPEALHECSERYNVHYIVTFSEPEEGVDPSERFPGFELVKTIGRNRIYANQHPGSYFVQGRGTIIQQLNRLQVTAEPASTVVLKFFWLPGLRTVPALALTPYPLPDGKAFIQVQTDFTPQFDIVYR